MSSYIPLEIDQECLSYRCLYVFHYLFSHCFETIRISYKTHQIKTTLFQFYNKCSNMKWKKFHHLSLSIKVKILTVIIFDRPTNQQKRS